MISFQLFIEKVISDVKERFGGDVALKVLTVLKNNGVKETGIAMLLQDGNAGPVFYLDSSYELYKEGDISMKMIVDEIYDIFNTFDLSGSSYGTMEDFDRLKDKIFYKLVSYEKNLELLENVPYVPYLDLAIVFYILAERNENGQSISMINNEIMSFWEVDVDILYTLAKENTPKLFPAFIDSMRNVMENIGKEYIGEPYDIRIDFPWYILSNQCGVNGAVAMLYEGVLKDCADMMGGDIVILPSSVHEVLLLPYREECDMDYLKGMVAHVNETEVPMSDILSDGVYVYDRGQDKVFMVPDKDMQ